MAGYSNSVVLSSVTCLREDLIAFEKKRKIVQKFAGNKPVFPLHVATEMIKSFTVLKLGHWNFLSFSNHSLEDQVISGSKGDGYEYVYCKCN